MNPKSWPISLIAIFLLLLTDFSNTSTAEEKNETQGFSWRRTFPPELQAAATQVLQNLVTGQKPVTTATQLTGSLTELKIDIINALSRFKLNPFTLFNAFIQAWRTSLPILAPIGNYTLLQLALVLAIGGLAAGAAVVAAEAFYFKTLHEEEVLHHHLRRNYDLFYRKTFLGETPAKVKSPKRVGTLPPKRYKPQSLRRTQRRNQRKNKNAGAQLDFYKKLKAAEALRRRGKRQVTFQPLNLQFPTVAPRPFYSPTTNTWRPPRPFYGKKPKKPEAENMFSLKFISNFLRRHGSNLMRFVPSMPTIPFFGSATSTNPKHPQQQQQYLDEHYRKQYPNQQYGFVRPRPNSRKTMIGKSFISAGKT